MRGRGTADKVSRSQRSREPRHHAVGAMLLKEPGFGRTVVGTVATHAGNAPFHGRNLEVYGLCYAGDFATGHAIMLGAAMRSRTTSSIGAGAQAG